MEPQTSLMRGRLGLAGTLNSLTRRNSFLYTGNHNPPSVHRPRAYSCLRHFSHCSFPIWNQDNAWLGWEAPLEKPAQNTKQTGSKRVWGIGKKYPDNPEIQRKTPTEREREMRNDIEIKVCWSSTKVRLQVHELRRLNVSISIYSWMHFLKHKLCFRYRVRN